MLKLVSALSAVNSAILTAMRQLGWISIAAMVVIILLQVFFRYILNSPLSWTEEAARYLMLWLVAFMAPSAYRWGGFVSIDMLQEALPGKARELLILFLTLISTLVLVVLIAHAWDHFNAGSIFASSALKIPLKWIYLSLGICFVLMLSVNIELLLRSLGRLVTGDDVAYAPPTAGDVEAGAE